MNLRSSARKIILNILGTFSTPANGVHILNGHRISLLSPKPLIFERQLHLLSKEVRFIRFEAAVNLIETRSVVNEPLVAFSFDDGFEEQYSMIAPILEKYGTNAAFFINPHFAEANEEYIKYFTEKTVLTLNKRPMRWNQIIDLEKRGHIIGAHTLDHYMINDYNECELRHQIGDCKKVIEDKLGKSCDYFAFPYGRLEHANPKSIELATEYYQYVFSQSDYKNYFSYNGQVINRRHFEPDWNISHLRYFISSVKKY